MAFNPQFQIQMIRDGDYWCAWMGGTADGYNWGYGFTVADALRALADDIERQGLRPDASYFDPGMLERLDRLMTSGESL